MNDDADCKHFSRAVAPLLAAFTLPAIVASLTTDRSLLRHPPRPGLTARTTNAFPMTKTATSRSSGRSKSALDGDVITRKVYCDGAPWHQAAPGTRLRCSYQG